MGFEPTHEDLTDPWLGLRIRSWTLSDSELGANGIRFLFQRRCFAAQACAGNAYPLIPPLTEDPNKCLKDSARGGGDCSESVQYLCVGYMGVLALAGGEGLLRTGC